MVKYRSKSLDLTKPMQCDADEEALESDVELLLRDTEQFPNRDDDTNTLSKLFPSP